MTDISAIQQNWQQELHQIEGDKASARSLNGTYAAAVAALEDKMGKMKGLWRLKKPFIKATKIMWLHHKQNKISRHLDDENAQLAAAAQDTFISLGKALVTGSTSTAKYSSLQNAIEQTESTKRIVADAANQCNRAGSQAYSPPAFYYGPNESLQQDAKDAIDQAREAVNSLQQQTDRAVPQIAASLSGWKIDSTYNGPAKDALNHAEGSLNEVIRGLYTVTSGLTHDQMTILAAVVAEKRATDTTVESLMASLDPHMPANKAVIRMGIDYTGP